VEPDRDLVAKDSDLCCPISEVHHWHRARYGPVPDPYPGASVIKL